MNTKLLFAAVIALSAFGCDKQMSSSTSAQEDLQAAAPVPPDQALANQPPAAGIGSESTAQVPAPAETAIPQQPALVEPSASPSLPAEAQGNQPDVPKPSAE